MVWWSGVGEGRLSEEKAGTEGRKTARREEYEMDVTSRSDGTTTAQNRC
jgi:hypothetical protein